MNDITPKCIVTVDAFINTTSRNANMYIPQPIKYEITLMYAKPIILKVMYHETIKHVLFCAITDTWDSITKKMAVAYKRNNFACHVLEYSRPFSHMRAQIDKSTWQFCRWSDTNVFTIKPLSLIWKSPLVTILTISGFMEQLTVEQKRKIWSAHATGQYIPTNEISHTLHSFVALCIKIRDRTAVEPSRLDLANKLAPFSDVIRQRIENAKGMSFDELNNDLHFWILEPLSEFANPFSLLWESPKVTIQMVSEFMERLPQQHKDKIWNRFATGQYITKNKILHTVHCFVGLCIKFTDRTAVAPSRNDLVLKLLPFVDVVRQRIQHKNGINVDEFNNELHFWILEPVTGRNWP